MNFANTEIKIKGDSIDIKTQYSYTPSDKTASIPDASVDRPFGLDWLKDIKNKSLVDCDPFLCGFLVVILTWSVCLIASWLYMRFCYRKPEVVYTDDYDEAVGQHDASSYRADDGPVAEAREEGIDVGASGDGGPPNEEDSDEEPLKEGESIMKIQCCVC